jgi:predicted nucleic acid-binding protein
LILPDINVLIYAFRADSKDHARFKAWLEDVVNGPAAYAISPQVLASVARICTHARIFAQPSSMDEVLEYCGALLGQPNAALVVPGERHWPLFGKLCRAANAGCEWITTDRDYARFTGLKWRSPF